MGNKQLVVGAVVALLLGGLVWILWSRTKQPEPASPSRMGTAINMKTVGLAPALDESSAAFFTSENAAERDLNQDGDLNDNIIQLYDRASGTVTSLQVDGVVPELSQGMLVFHIDESQLQQDFNDDGDTDDNVVRVYDVPRQTLTDVRLTGAFPHIDDDIIVFHTREMWIDEDLNGDGDTEDLVVRYYKLSTGQLVNTRADGVRATVEGGRIAFHTFEHLSQTDLNGDGDQADVIVRLYDINTGQVTNTRTIGQYPSVFGDTVVFETREGLVEADLNDDGDQADTVLRSYDLASAKLTDLALSGSFPTLFETTLAFDSKESEVGRDLNGDGDLEDNVIHHYDLSNGTLTNTGIAGTNPSLFGETLIFYTHESWIGQDLNGDGDTQDYVLRSYALSSE